MKGHRRLLAVVLASLVVASAASCGLKGPPIPPEAAKHPGNLPQMNSRTPPGNETHDNQQHIKQRQKSNDDRQCLFHSLEKHGIQQKGSDEPDECKAISGIKPFTICDRWPANVTNT